MSQQHVRVAIPDGHRDKLRDIASRLARLSPNYQNPHRFYRDRDDLVDELDQLARPRR